MPEPPEWEFCGNRSFISDPDEFKDPTGWFDVWK
jgi:hypothetical protein